MSIVGRTYLERGEPVEILAQWRTGTHRCHAMPLCAACGRFGVWLFRGCPCGRLATVFVGPGPRNVLIRRADGSEVVRPFRGLRRPK